MASKTRKTFLFVPQRDVRRNAPVKPCTGKGEHMRFYSSLSGTYVATLAGQSAGRSSERGFYSSLSGTYVATNGDTRSSTQMPVSIRPSAGRTSQRHAPSHRQCRPGFYSSLSGTYVATREDTTMTKRRTPSFYSSLSGTYVATWSPASTRTTHSGTFLFVPQRDVRRNRSLIEIGS